ncbi:XRE family transcriptional regulator [Bacillus toyonensis]|uniref:helix-turn-helix domain-containing protein n=1 Tax=Bacillus cereus group TaxID=86661 RepID=UPI000B416A17|nr:MULTISPECIES: helix-turn-helix transcriptional regulator [Bacillus cereus group]MEB9697769.1 helix-turn-helix transcriptional regulator [Bacillus cereus]ARX66042.1 transcriptional regulator [Bacillus thuringiensis]PEF14028.1 XRE family transcriptional regulator [Bacillus thuringiensis]PGC14125.1 XRE family transcriptional regulator [Bacillus toyonensis]PGC72709.1 XRE family transcriptional regulator [Bacillus toyonensis]
MFGNTLNSLRKEKKLRQEDMAKHLGIARTTYAMYEQGNREPDYDTLQKLANFFDVSVDYLLGRTNEKLPLIDFSKDPDLNIWFKDIKDASPEKREELKQFWEFIKQKKEKR